MSRVTIDGKQFARGGRRYPFRGVTYGTFEPRLDGALFPSSDVVKRDFSAMAEHGFNVVRTYTPPTDDLLELAEEFELTVLAGVFYPDWRYLVGTTPSDLRAVARGAREAVRTTARRLADHPAVLGLCVGNEIPADVLRWVGTARVARIIDALADVAHDTDPELLVTYANYPTAEYLHLPGLDFLTFNVFLERQEDFRRYLNRLHNLAGDRPLVLGEIGLDCAATPAGERAQAAVLDWQLETAVERGVAGTCVFSWTDDWWVGGQKVEGWHFGLTRDDRSPRPALDVAEGWNRRTVADLDFPWPSVSVVICAYNAEATLDECLRHTCALDYPRLEIVVVDDGSGDATADIARRHPRARLVSIPHAGLGVARNAGFQAANGDLIAYLDSDAYPTPEWLYYLALGMNSRDVAAVGGPNVPPRDDPPGAHVVARAPGGPVHVLTGDDRAEHVPGCNMAFWRYALSEVGGFDAVYTAAGDDVDVCWKVLDRGWEIGFHPAALVWHHRRDGLRPYLRQQRGYGRSESLVAVRHPERYTALGTARWSGRIYNSFVPRLARQRVYRGLYGAAAFQSVYGAGGHGLDVAHQAGVPLAVGLLPSAALGAAHPALLLPAIAALALLAGLFAVDMRRARPPRTWTGSRLRFRASVALLEMLQPLVRLWGRWNRNGAARPAVVLGSLPAPASRRRRGLLVVPADRPRADLAALVVAHLRHGGLRVLPVSGWEDYDGRAIGSTLVVGDLVTSAYPEGWVQLRMRMRVRWRRVGLVAVAVAGTSFWWPLAALVAAAAAADTARGWWRLRRRLAALAPSSVRLQRSPSHGGTSANAAARDAA